MKRRGTRTQDNLESRGEGGTEINVIRWDGTRLEGQSSAPSVLCTFPHSNRAAQTHTRPDTFSGLVSGTEPGLGQVLGAAAPKTAGEGADHRIDNVAPKRFKLLLFLPAPTGSVLPYAPTRQPRKSKALLSSDPSRIWRR